MHKLFHAILAAAGICVLAANLQSCADLFVNGTTNQAGSMVGYLFPDAKTAPQMQTSTALLRPPVKVGIALVPPEWGGNELPEAEKTRLLERVKAAFSSYDYIGKIQIVPTSYLQPRGGFANMERVARMLDFEVAVLVSYDQIQFVGSNSLAMLYWTIVGAYLIHGS
ncbi:MAG: hypothetical protein MO853_04500 [Candidatus Protistobacter heckmanni]|nr:hypothetical protein [Candidatus Protistobacter heckmanni]